MSTSSDPAVLTDAPSATADTCQVTIIGVAPLTPQQRAILEHLISTTEAGVQATAQEICSLLGFASKQARLVVELDGHEFHERTKWQATRDKERDRNLQLAGWSVFRFTGSEIWKNPKESAWTVLKYFFPGIRGIHEVE